MLSRHLARRAPQWARGYASDALASETAPGMMDVVKNIVMPAGPPVPKVPNLPSSLLLPAVETRITTLPNGMRVATEVTPGEMATVGAWIDTGSRYESASTNGTAHFLEHMAFKGTPTRPQERLEREVEQMGAHINAYTSRENTVFFARAFRNDVSAAVDLVADIIQNPNIDTYAMDRERDVILKEMEEVDLQHTELVFDKLHQMAFRGTSLGRSIIGPEENVRNLTKDDLTQFIRTHYTADKMVFVGTGAVDHDALCKEVEAKFASLPMSPPEGVKVDSGGKPHFVGSDIRMREDDMEEAHIALAFESLPWNHADALVLTTMVSLLGVWEKSMSMGRDSAGKLARVFAADNIGSKVMPFNTPYNDTGLFGVYAVLPAEQIPTGMWQIQEEITRLCYEVDEEDVKRAINQVKGNMVYNLDGSQQVAEDIGRQLLTLGRRMSLKESFDRLDAITAADIKRVANDLFFDQDPVMAAIGPIQKLPDYGKLRRRTYWLRY